jgi:hypothetical protein
MEQRICQLEFAAGHRRSCPGDTCPFWVDDRCVVAPLWADFGANPDLVELLMGLRRGLEERDPRRALRTFHPPGLV